MIRRPRSVTIAGWLIVLQGLGLLGVVGTALVLRFTGDGGLLPAWMATRVPIGRQVDLVLALGQLVLVAAMLVSGYGVLRLRRWAWPLAMIVQGLNLALLLYEYARGLEPFVEMCAGAAIVFVLNQREVQRAFSAAQHRAEPASLLTAQDDRAVAQETHESLARRR
jgi:hypothetical protein